jgi:threonine/homoserine/homoserine lactone efflux protein
MTFPVFVSAVLAILIAPGPTNTLMGVAGAQSGLRGVARLLPAELFGYLTTILPLTYLGAELLGRHPAGAIALKVVAAVWVMLLAVKLWGRRADTDASGEVTAHRVYLTTTLNPKALIFGLVLFPAPVDPQFAPKLGLFILMVVAVALAWGTAGTLTQIGGGGSHRLQTIQRLASVWLAVVSVTLLAGAIRA